MTDALNYGDPPFISPPAFGRAISVGHGQRCIANGFFHNHLRAADFHGSGSIHPHHVDSVIEPALVPQTAFLAVYCEQQYSQYFDHLNSDQ